jgi:hypothetical protein
LKYTQTWQADSSHKSRCKHRLTSQKATSCMRSRNHAVLNSKCFVEIQA